MAEVGIVEKIAFVSEELSRKIYRNKNLIIQNSKSDELLTILSSVREIKRQIEKIACRPLGGGK